MKMHEREMTKVIVRKVLLRLKRIGSFRDEHIKEENTRAGGIGVIHMLYVLSRLEGFPISTVSLGKILKMNRFLIYLKHLK